MSEKLKIVFAPGAFDTFDGTQEELDTIVKNLTELIESGEFLTKGRLISREELEDLPDDVLQNIALITDETIDQDYKRRLN